MGETAHDFGCGDCYGADAEAAWRHLRDSRRPGQILVDDSHFIVGLFGCGSCEQGYVSVFTEFIDWSGGDDAQYTTYLPVTEAEAADLADGRMDVHDVGQLGAGRRHLNSDWPTGGPRRITWAAGRFQVVEGR